MGDASPYNYTLNNPVNNTDQDGMSVDGPVEIRNDYHFDGNQLTPEMSAQYLKKNAELGVNLN